MEKKNKIGLGPILLVLFCVACLLATAWAADVVFQRRADRVWIGAGGTEFNLLAVGQLELGASATSKTITVTGLASGDIPIVTANEDLESITDYYATAGTNQLTLMPNASTASAITFNYMVFGLP